MPRYAFNIQINADLFKIIGVLNKVTCPKDYQLNLAHPYIL